MSALKFLALVAGAISTVSAHGHVQGIVVGGKYYEGYDASFQYQSPAPTVIGWSTPEVTDNGFVSPDNYTKSPIICHIGATPAGMSAPIAAGGKVELQWTEWPDSHHGPVLTYLAKCSGKCESVDPESLEFFKIDEGGLVKAQPNPGTWASDQLIANNNSWTVTIPSTIASGNYVLRHEIIALHSAGNADGAQNYPQCINLQVTGGGSANPSGESAEKFYTPTEAGILVDIYSGLTSYKIPGPPVYGGGSGSPPASSTAPVSTSASSAPTSSASVPAPPSSSATSSAPVYSSPAASSTGAVSVSSSGVATSVPSSIYPSSSKCTTTITLTSSSVVSSGVAPVTTSGGPGGYPVPSSLTAPISTIPVPSSGFPVPSSGFPYPTGTALSSGLPTSGPVASSTYVVPTVSASSPAGYPTGTQPITPPAGGDPNLEALLAKLLKLIKNMFRQAEHGRDFKRGA